MTSDYTPRKNVPFHAVIKGICGYEVVAIPSEDKEGKELLAVLHSAGKCAGENILKYPIPPNTRINEVGNKIEPYVKKALSLEKAIVADPFSQTSGYPDIRIRYGENKVCYIECKTYSSTTEDSPFRSFYLSPSKSFKVNEDANHVLLSYEMEKRENGYIPIKFKLIDLRNLLCDLKFEWNSNNRKLYTEEATLAVHNFS